MSQVMPASAAKSTRPSTPLWVSATIYVSQLRAVNKILAAVKASTSSCWSCQALLVFVVRQRSHLCEVQAFPFTALMLLVLVMVLVSLSFMLVLLCCCFLCCRSGHVRGG